MSVVGQRGSRSAAGAPGAPGIVLVHGSAAHAGWWDHVAAALADEAPLVAPDLSGHGRGPRRASYTLSGWAGEVAAAHAALGPGPHVVVGHSMGALVALRVVEEHPDLVAALVLVDPPFRTVDTRARALRSRIVTKTPRVYASRKEAEARWRPAPDQPILSGLREAIAAGSVGPVEGGWGWRFDPRTFDRPDVDVEEVGQVGVPALVLRAGHGMLEPARAERLVARLGATARLEVVPDGHHHLMLDQPDRVVDAIRRTRARALAAPAAENRSGR
ncbi:alpha/beta hydrolase [Nocardioides zeae]|uniref:Alpha/beta hydrolase n=1 Tax=Nocardioides imazamoxiresistens TaxID=3231893 RepID=A0ABU3PSD5_9ACTN|nr:alpha/beta hydrolase [Nocardioides zeae]MDT9592142.1 alpha/beta hydrolase [Nocardioides zeae]